MSFQQIHEKYNWDEICESIRLKTSHDVKRALGTSNPDLEDFKALVSPAAEPFLEQMAQKSLQLTQTRFGKTVQMYIPLYLSNECANGCIYCGFNCKNQIDRCTLSREQVMEEVKVIKSLGFEHILLVTGEHPKRCGVDYIEEVVKMIKPYFANISIEIAPLDREDYTRLKQHGLNTVYVYQETYHKENYGNYHPRGKKADFNYRLDTPDRIGLAGIHRIGLGCLLGLEDWRADSFFTALHIHYLEQKYWRTKFSISFPRLRPHAGSFQPKYPINDRQLVQLMCAYRIFNQELEISLSTRENHIFRDNMIGIGVTSMSAGSKTEPGGYSNPDKELKQFEVSDDRTADEISQAIQNKGYEPVWKDWDHCLVEC